MTPLFTIFESGTSQYELKKYGAESFSLEFENEAKDNYYQTEFERYLPRRKSFIPCPFCNTLPPAVLTFSSSTFCGTNTSGGTETSYYEVYCQSCKLFSVFEHENVSYPYD